MITLSKSHDIMLLTVSIFYLLKKTTKKQNRNVNDPSLYEVNRCE